MKRPIIALLSCLVTGTATSADVSGPSADELRPHPERPDSVIETRDLGEADMSGRTEMPQRWGENERAPAKDASDASAQTQSDRAVNRLFSRLDVDSNGQLARGEAQADAVIYRHFRDLDANADDSLDDGEFRRIGTMTPRFGADGALLTLGRTPDDATRRN